MLQKNNRICAQLLAFLILLIAAVTVQCKVIQKASIGQDEQQSGRQFLFFGTGKETSAPNFIRMVVMRFIYGLASTMGVEERLEDLFNGAFVPPNADGDFLGFGGGGGGGDIGDIGDYGDLGGLFGGADDLF